MNIGFLLPGNFAAGNPGNGVLAQARFQAQALENLGHNVIRMTPWEPAPRGSIDVLQFFLGGYVFNNIQNVAHHLHCPLFFASIIDSNQSNFSYRLAALLGNLVPRFDTIPGVFRSQALNATNTIVRSQHEFERIAKGLGVPEAKIRLVLNGITPAADTNPQRAREQLSLPERFVLHVSAYTQARKNVHRLVEAAGQLGYPLVIAGYAPQDERLDKLMKHIGNYPNVRVLGFQSRQMLNDLMAACEVFALPSTHEGTGLVALEAGALGAKIVITQNGGPKDYFLDYADYVNPGSLESIKAALKAAWERPSNGQLRAHIVNNLSWEQSAKGLIEVYEASLNRI